jgi:hypothetical protein
VDIEDSLLAVKRVGAPLTVEEMARLNVALCSNPVIDLQNVPSLVGTDTAEWNRGTWQRLTTQILGFTSSMVVSARGCDVVLSCSQSSNNNDAARLDQFWGAMLQLQLNASENKEEAIAAQLEGEKRKATETPKKATFKSPKKTHEKFPAMVGLARDYVALYSCTAQDRRRNGSVVVSTGSNKSTSSGQGFRLVDLLYHLYKHVSKSVLVVSYVASLFSFKF